jgi:pSer/pThr/pTyr-binding forkhead associated (FHA) protein
MSFQPNGELIPDGGGDNIPLIRDILTIGRRESCDIPMRYPNVSGLHCELVFKDGFWYIKDLGSTNGIKVNGVRVPRKLLHPGEKITIAKKSYTIQYDPPINKRGMEELMEDMEDEDILSQPLLERAGLIKPRRDQKQTPQNNKSAPKTGAFDPGQFLLADDGETE